MAQVVNLCSSDDEDNIPQHFFAPTKQQARSATLNAVRAARKTSWQSSKSQVHAPVVDLTTSPEPDSRPRKKRRTIEDSSRTRDNIPPLTAAAAAAQPPSSLLRLSNLRTERGRNLEGAAANSAVEDLQSNAGPLAHPSCVSAAGISLSKAISPPVLTHGRGSGQKRLFEDSQPLSSMTLPPQSVGEFTTTASKKHGKTKQSFVVPSVEPPDYIVASHAHKDKPLSSGPLDLSSHGSATTSKVQKKRLSTIPESPPMSPVRTHAMQKTPIHSSARLDTGVSEELFRKTAQPSIPVEANPVMPLSATTTHSDSMEKVVGQYFEEMLEDNEYYTRTELQRARMKLRMRSNTSAAAEATSVFSKLIPISVQPLTRKGVPTGCVKFTTEMHHAAGKSGKTSYMIGYTTYNTSDIIEVPRYSHYVSISHNLLAHNVTSLQHWPYFGDDFEMEEAYALKKEYYVDVDERERKLLRLGQAENFAPYADDLINDVGCKWSDVLTFLLELKPNVGNDVHALQALQNRESFVSEDFIRNGERWRKVLAKLPATDPVQVGKAAMLCDHFQRALKFPFWHMVRRAEFTKELVAQTAVAVDTDNLTCQVCTRFSCPYHGEILDHTDRSEDASDAYNERVETDIILPQVVNFRTRVEFPLSVDDEPAKPDKKRTLDYWEKGQFGNLKWKAEERGPFYPCHHPGITCSDARCSCFDARVACEKLCSCGPGCKRKWMGCSCHSSRRQQGRPLCWEDDRCACFQKSRECDPDLCGSCGVVDVLDPVHRHDDRILQGRCGMASIQRGVSKHTILGNSGVHGLGLYACEDIRADDFVGEYKGETITKDEAERRGAVYEHQRLSYLFTLNLEQEVDGTRYGNKLRFINHADASKSNLKPLIIMVNSVFRIVMYAKRNIKAGEELFFDYGPSFPKDQLGGKPAKPKNLSKSAPHVRNSGHVRDDFYDIDISRDQLGNIRATKRLAGSDRSDHSSDDGQDAASREGRHPPGATGMSAATPRRRGGAHAGAAPPEVDDDRLDSQQRLSIGSAEDDDFEPEEYSASDREMESDSE